MTRDDPSQILVGLIRIRRVLVHAVDVPAAQRAGDAAAVAYASAMAAWRREAAQAAAMALSPCQGRHAAPDAFARIATALALTQQAAE